MQKTLASLLIFLGLLLSVPAVYAASSMSNIVLSKYNLTLAPGTTGAVTYTVNLANGAAGGTSLNVADSGKLTANGIDITLSNPSGTPSFSGKLLVTLSSGTQTGSYSVILQAIGEDPSVKNVTLTLNVSSSQPTKVQTTTIQPTTNTTKPVGGTSSTNTSSASGNTPSSNSSINSTSQNHQASSSSGSLYSLGSSSLLVIAIIIIIIILITAAYLARKRSQQTPPSQPTQTEPKI